MAMLDRVTGPISRDRLRELADAPFGQAREAIQRYDPFWGRGGGEKIEYVVTVSGYMHGRAYLKAASQEEADKLADELSDEDIDWGDHGDDFTVLTVEPYNEK